MASSDRPAEPPHPPTTTERNRSMTDQPINPVQAIRDARHAYWARIRPDGDDVEAEWQADRRLQQPPRCGRTQPTRGESLPSRLPFTPRHPS